MSWRVAKECAERKFGSAPRKQIIMFLADKASDDGSGIWCFKGTIQRHTELGASTVKMALIACCLGMSATITAFAVKSWFEPKMHMLGITVMERPDATYLMATGERTTLQLCTLAGQQVDCLRIEKE